MAQAAVADDVAFGNLQHALKQQKTQAVTPPYSQALGYRVRISASQIRIYNYYPRNIWVGSQSILLAHFNMAALVSIRHCRQ